MAKKQTSDDEILKVLHIISNITGQTTSYGALLGFLRHVAKKATFHTDVLRPQSLVWDDCAIITLESAKPLQKLCMQDDVTVKDVIMLRDTSLPDHVNIVDNEESENESKVIPLSPCSVVARAAADNAKIMKYVNATINRDQAAYEQAIKDAWHDEYITCMDSNTTLNAVKALAVFQQMDEDVFVNKLKEWFPNHAKEVKKHKNDAEAYFKKINIRSEEDGRLAFMLWGAFQDSDTIDIKKGDDNIQKMFIATRQAIEDPYERIGIAIQKPTSTQKKLRDLMRKSSLYIMGNTVADGLYEAIHDILASEKLSIDILEHVPLNDDDYMDVMSATQCALFISNDDEIKTTTNTARSSFTMLAIKAMAKKLRIERDAVLDLHQTVNKLQAQIADDKAKAQEEKNASMVSDAEFNKLKEATANAEQLASDKQAKLNEAQISIDKLTVQNDQLAKENEELREFLAALQAADEEEEQEQQSQNMPTSKRNIPEGAVLIGGHPRWQKMFKSVYPHVKIVDGTSATFSTDMFNAKTPLVLINPKHMKHSVWYKLMPQMRRYKIPYEYCTRINNELVQG